MARYISGAKFLQHLTRRKAISGVDLQDTQLARVLSTWDLTFIGIGATLGLGIYVLAGSVARDTAGPAVIISFLIAAIACAFSGLCYAEFAARIPKAGSAYVYSYVTVGEFVAFVIGWNFILECVIGAASVAKGLTTYIDSLTGWVMRDTLTNAMPMEVDFLSDYPDFLAFGVAVVFSGALAFGMKESSMVNNACTAINLAVIVFVVIAGAINADTSNWSIVPDHVHDNSTNIKLGGGGFAPFGVSGVIKGAATCFYGFVGFDAVASTGEEAKTPQKSIPLAIFGTLAVVFASYFGISTVITLMWPYYLQDPDAPLTYVFEKIDWDAAKWVVSVGAVFGLLSSLFGSLYALPRILYAMAIDGLLFAPLGWVSKKYKTPVLATLLSGVFTGAMALLFNLQQLVEMMSIGTLMAYSIVSACVLILRYRKTEEDDLEEATPIKSGSLLKRNIRQILNLDRLEKPTEDSSFLASTMVVGYCVLTLSALAVVVFLPDQLSDGVAWPIVLLAIFIISAIICLASLAVQPESKKKLYFMVPLVPLIPAVSLMMNLYLMLMLEPLTWIRFSVWMAVGLAIYFAYGTCHSKARFTSNKSRSRNRRNI